MKKSNLEFEFINFACDAGVKRNNGRPGAAEGPKAFWDEFAKLKPLGAHSHAMTIHCEGDNLETAQTELADAVEKTLNQGKMPIVIGGGHELSWGHFQGLARTPAVNNLGIINFDAHFDVRKQPQASSGTSFRQIALYCQQHNLPYDYTCLGIQPNATTPEQLQFAKDHNVHYEFAQNIHRNPKLGIQYLEEAVARCDKLYVSICLDVFILELAPGVSAPQENGLPEFYILDYLTYLAHSGKVVSFDIAELAPCYDRYGSTAELAAKLIWHFMHELIR